VRDAGLPPAHLPRHPRLTPENTTATPLAKACLSAGAHYLDKPLVLALGLVWLAHIGNDRLLGYGLKHDDNFQHTHFGQLGQPGGTP